MTRQQGNEKLRIEGLRKTYGEFAALENIDLAVNAGEFLTLLGPSGSGKSTLLWAIAGLNAPDEGRILIDGADMTHVPAHARGLGMVFQNYALFPHMTIFDNIAFPLKMRRRGGSDIRKAVAQALEAVRLEHVGDRYPAALSGGQQQRVALARAIVYRPSIILMDEPLGALDKKLRDHLQLEIKALHEKLGVTVIYVTHDQEEAMVMSDRICLMNNAAIEQIGTPIDLYHRPRTLFAADFLGESNLMALEVDEANPGTGHLAGSDRLHFVPSDHEAGTVNLMVRPDAVTVCLSRSDETTDGRINRLAATVNDIVIAGALTKVFAKLRGGQAMQANLLTGQLPEGLEPGAAVRLCWPAEAGVALPVDGGS